MFDWKPRDMKTHKRNLEKLLNAETKTELKKLESSFGMKYSPLVKLPYFNVIKTPCDRSYAQLVSWNSKEDI